MTGTGWLTGTACVHVYPLGRKDDGTAPRPSPQSEVMEVPPGTLGLGQPAAHSSFLQVLRVPAAETPARLLPDSAHMCGTQDPASPEALPCWRSGQAEPRSRRAI